VSVWLWEEVQAVLRCDKLNPGWFREKLGDRWLHGRLCRLPETPCRDKYFTLTRISSKLTVDQHVVPFGERPEPAKHAVLTP
jgi:hypothetical protein